MNAKTLAAIHVQLDEGTFADAWDQGRKITVDEAMAVAVAAMEEAVAEVSV